MLRQRTTRLVIGTAVLAVALAGPLAALASAHPATVVRTTPRAAKVTYTVRAGDSFYGIARRFSISPGQLAQANGLRLNTMLYPGRVLTIPVQLPAGLPANLPAALMANPDRLQLYPTFVAAAKEFSVPVDLLMATDYIESGWTQSALSKTGAVGVGQLLPDTSAWIAIVLLHDPTLDPSNARDNIRMSARFLGYVLDASGGDTARALASYYQGPGSVQRDGITATGLAYGSRILAARPAFR
jgi:soluble lytic murein transglycosylase-like protein